MVKLFFKSFYKCWRLISSVIAKSGGSMANMDIGGCNSLLSLCSWSNSARCQWWNSEPVVTEEMVGVSIHKSWSTSPIFATIESKIPTQTQSQMFWRRPGHHGVCHSSTEIEIHSSAFRSMSDFQNVVTWWCLKWLMFRWFDPDAVPSVASLWIHSPSYGHHTKEEFHVIPMKQLRHCLDSKFHMWWCSYQPMSSILLHQGVTSCNPANNIVKCISSHRFNNLSICIVEVLLKAQWSSAWKLWYSRAVQCWMRSAHVRMYWRLH